MKILHRLSKICIVTLITIVSVSTNGCAKFILMKPDGNDITRPFAVEGFNKIRISNAFYAELKKGIADSVIVTVPENVMPYVNVSVSEGELTVKLRDNTNVKCDGCLRVIVVYAIVPKEIEASGAAKIIVLDTLRNEKLKIETSGASFIDVAFNVSNKASLDASGASKINAVATASQIEIDASGASKIEATATASQMDIDASGASKITGTWQVSGKAEIELSGAAQWTGKGFIHSVKADISGASNFGSFDILSDVMNGDFSGASKGTLTIAQSLSLSLSGASKFKYRGNPAISHLQTGGGSTVEKE
ncbi:MAG: DUF2807 domain-containing protein [Bacteroidales bacterium]|jgi:hypothetical protein|nr:DUF2807 domain-containing protein [Bacteroidales bacterium]